MFEEREERLILEILEHAKVIGVGRGHRGGSFRGDFGSGSWVFGNEVLHGLGRFGGALLLLGLFQSLHGLADSLGSL